MTYSCIMPCNTRKTLLTLYKTIISSQDKHGEIIIFHFNSLSLKLSSKIQTAMDTKVDGALTCKGSGNFLDQESPNTINNSFIVTRQFLNDLIVFTSLNTSERQRVISDNLANLRLSNRHWFKPCFWVSIIPSAVNFSHLFYNIYIIIQHVCFEAIADNLICSFCPRFPQFIN